MGARFLQKPTSFNSLMLCTVILASFTTSCRQHSASRVQQNPSPADTNFSTVETFFKNNAATFRLQDPKNKKQPTAVIFSETRIQRSIAAVVNRKDGNPAPEGGGVLLHFVGIQFKRPITNPKMVEVTFVGKTSKYIAKQQIPVQQLLSGEVVKLELPKTKKNYYFASVTANAWLHFRLTDTGKNLDLIEGGGVAEIDLVGRSPEYSRYKIKNMVGLRDDSLDFSQLKELQ